MCSTASGSRPTASGSSSSRLVVTDSGSLGIRTRWNTSGMPGRRGTLSTSESCGLRGATRGNLEARQQLRVGRGSGELLRERSGGHLGLHLRELLAQPADLLELLGLAQLVLPGCTGVGRDERRDDALGGKAGVQAEQE